MQARFVVELAFVSLVADDMMKNILLKCPILALPPFPQAVAAALSLLVLSFVMPYRVPWTQHRAGQSLSIPEHLAPERMPHPIRTLPLLARHNLDQQS